MHKHESKKAADGRHGTERVGRQTAQELEQWLEEHGLELADADGVEVTTPTPTTADRAEPSPLSLRDTESTARLDAATIQKLREAAAASKRPSRNEP